MQNTTSPPLRILRDPNAPKSYPFGREPSRTLGEHGQRPWDRVTAEFEVEDAARIELLTQACQAVDRADALAGHIAADGEIVRTRNGVKTHRAIGVSAPRGPLQIKEELACRGFAVRTHSRLRLNYEPLRAPRSAARQRPPAIGEWAPLPRIRVKFGKQCQTISGSRRLKRRVKIVRFGAFSGSGRSGLSLLLNGGPGARCSIAASGRATSPLMPLTRTGTFAGACASGC